MLRPARRTPEVGPSRLIAKRLGEGIDRVAKGSKPEAELQKGGDPTAGSPTVTLLRLHPSYLPLLGDRPPLQVGLATSGATNSHGVTGGVYKARERIHPGVLIRDY